jgi:LemA protein
MAAFQSAQDNLSQSLGRLMVVIERYPELKANQIFWSFRHNWKAQRTG